MSVMDSELTKTRPGADMFVRNRVLLIVGVIGILAAAFLYYDYVRQGPVICPLHGLAGFPCPACGLTRAFCHLTRFEIMAALQMNALSLPLLVAFITALGVAAVELITGKAMKFYRFIFSTRLALILGAAVAAYHIFRVGAMILDGSLGPLYWETSWTYAILQNMAP